MAESYRLLRMEPGEAGIPNHPEVVGQVEIDVGDAWPPVVALFIDVGSTPPELIDPFIRRVRDSLQGLFPPGQVMYVPRRGPSIGCDIFRLEPEAPDRCDCGAELPLVCKSCE